MPEDKIQATPPRFTPEFYTKLAKKADSEHRSIAAEIERLTMIGFHVEEVIRSNGKGQNIFS